MRSTKAGIIAGKISTVEPTYFAFISYSHVDKAAASKIQSRLERIRIPREFSAALPTNLRHRKRLSPIFRDRDEIPTTSSLPAALRQFLDQSAYLIVLCSPDATRSDWVNQEIEYFQSLGRADKILCAVVRRSAPTDTDIASVLPAALKKENAPLPLAADLTGKHADFSKEITRVAAGILGVSFDMLYRRESRRKRKALTISTSAIAASALIVFGFWYFQWQRAETKAQEVLQKQSLFLAEKSNAAAAEFDYNKAAAIALEGMPDEKRSIRRPLEPVLQAALSRSYWRLPAIEQLGDGSTYLAARVTDDGVVGVSITEENSWAIVGPQIKDPVVLEDTVVSADVNEAGTIVATGTAAGALTLYDGAGKITKTISAHEGSIREIRVAAGADLIATLGQDGFVKVWNIKLENIFQQTFDGGPLSVEFSHDGSRIIVASWGAASVWTIEGQKKTFEAKYSNSAVSTAAFSPNGYDIVVGVDNSVRFWNLNSNSEFHRLSTAGEFLSYLEFNKSGNWLLGAEVEGTMHVWELGADRSIAELVSGIDGFSSARFTADGTKILASNGPLLWTPEQIVELDPARVAMHRSERLNQGFVNSNSQAGSVELVLPGGSPRYTIPMQPAGSVVFDISADGTVLVTADTQKLQFWDVAGNNLRTMDIDAEYVQFSDSGHSVEVISGSKGAIQVEAPVLGQDLVDGARKRVSYCLSRTERVQLGLDVTSQGDATDQGCD